MSDPRRLLDDLDAAREKATPGPWRTGGSGIVAGLEYVASGVRTDPDAALIVAAVNNLPRLTAAIRAVLDLAEQYGGVYDESSDGSDDGWVSGVRQVAADISAAITAALNPAPPDGPTS